MLIRTRSSPRGILSYENTFFNDRYRRLPKIGNQLRRHNGSHLLEKILKFDMKSQQSPLEDHPNRSATPTHISLATDKTAPLNRRGIVVKESMEQGHLAYAPASLIYEEQSLRKFFLKSDNNTPELPETVEVRLSDELDSKRRDNVRRELHFSIPHSFVQHGGDPSALPLTTKIIHHEDVSQINLTKGVASIEETTLRKIWKERKEKKRTGSLILLNVLAALYGSSNVANRFVADAAPSLPASLTSLVRFTAALIFFTPSLVSALKNRDMGLLLAGAELGGLTFAATVVDSYNPTSGSSSCPALLFAFTVVFVPMMELFTGRRQLSSRLARLATLAAIFGMGLLEEEGFGWKGISWPQISDVWGVAVSIIWATHIFRSETHGSRFDPLRLNAVQCGMLAILSLGWETLSTFYASTLQCHTILDQIQSLPWAPLIYNGLVCFGLCSWLELHGLRSIHASTATLVYTTIPVWGACLSFFTQHDTPAESAIMGAAVIVVTSIYAQITTKNADTDFQINCLPLRSSPINQKQSVSQHSLNETMTKDELTSEATGNIESLHYYPGALLTSQLKFPYYAAQAKRLFAEVKIKLGALKSILLANVSSSMLPTGSSDPVVSSNTGSGTAPPGTTNGASNLSGSGPAVHIATLDVSTAQHSVHGPATDSALSSPDSDAIDVALSTIHSGDLAVLVNISVHTFTNVTTSFQSAIVAVGSDIMLAFEEVEDVATLLERLLQAGADNTTDTVAVCMAGGWGTWLSENLSPSGSSPSNFVESAEMQHLHQAFGGNCFLSIPYLADGVADTLLQVSVPLVNLLQI